MTLLQQKLTCNHLKAALMQNIAKFKNNDVSGIFAILCARHGFLKHRGWLICRRASSEFPSHGGICVDLIWL
jgi:hypothetical protein